jgi:hypothetical protein
LKASWTLSDVMTMHLNMLPGQIPVMIFQLFRVRPTSNPAKAAAEYFVSYVDEVRTGGDGTHE